MTYPNAICSPLGIEGDHTAEQRQDDGQLGCKLNGHLGGTDTLLPLRFVLRRDQGSGRSVRHHEGREDGTVVLREVSQVHQRRQHPVIKHVDDFRWHLRRGCLHTHAEELVRVELVPGAAVIPQLTEEALQALLGGCANLGDARAVQPRAILLVLTQQTSKAVEQAQQRLCRLSSQTAGLEFRQSSIRESSLLLQPYRRRQSGSTARTTRLHSSRNKHVPAGLLFMRQDAPCQGHAHR